MANARGETEELPVALDRGIKLEFHGVRITSDSDLIAYRELDDALGLTTVAASGLAAQPREDNIHHQCSAHRVGDLWLARRLFKVLLTVPGFSP